MDRRTWVYIAIIAVAISICVVALWWAGITPLSIAGGQTIKVPLSGVAYSTAAANGLDVYSMRYTASGIYVYSATYNSSILLPAVGQARYLVYPLWNKRVTFTWTRTGTTYAYVRILTSSS